MTLEWGWGSGVLKKLLSEIRPPKRTPAGNSLAREAALACFVQEEGQKEERLLGAVFSK